MRISAREDKVTSDSDLFSVSESEVEERPSTLGARLTLGGRLGSSASSSMDMPGVLPDEDDDAIANVSQRFRRPALGAQSIQRSLDESEPEEVDASALESFVLDALEPGQIGEPKSDYVLEEVVDETTRLDSDKLAQFDARQRRLAQEPATGDRICPHCSSDNPPGMRFCVQCGGSLQISAKSALSSRKQPQVRMPPPPTEASRQANPWEIFMISINEDGSDGIVIQLEFLETTVGREGDTRFPTDAFLSPKHARLHIEKGKLFIEDLYSLNGTFLKLRDEVKLTPGDTFLMGRQVLRFERFEQSISPKTKSSDGTRYMGSPAPGGNYKILQVGIGGVVQNVYCLPESGAVLGREKGDIIFPHDKFMSSRHAQIYTGDDGNCYLVDLTSSNGTWIKIWEKTQLRHNDYIFMGQQLFRIHIKDH